MPSFWNDPIGFIVQWLTGLLTGWGAAPDLIKFLLALLGAIVVPLCALMFVIFLIWYERKLLGRIQDRPGPNRVGPFGICQTFADMGKIFTKEIVNPTGIDVIPYNLAPILAAAAVLMIWAVMPFGPRIVGTNLSVGLLLVIGVGGIGELGVMLAGWSSNNKYALMGGFRAAALLVSYEIPMVISMLIPAMLAGSLNLTQIVEGQFPIAYIFMSPLAALVFFIAQIAESGRAPFDLTEAESEIVAGINVEYSGLKFGFFYVADFLHAFTSAMLFSTLFLGGYQGPFVQQVPLLGFLYLLIKTFFVYTLTVILRGSLPRFRMDQMLNLNWKVLTPLALTMVFATALVDKGVTQLTGSLAGTPLAIVRTAVLLVVNVIIYLVASRLLENGTQITRQVITRERPLAVANPEATSTGQD